VLVSSGASIDDIAARHLMKPGQVRQALSLAKLAPEVRNAWRDGKIDGQVAEAFALTADHKIQARLLKKMGNSINPWQVRRELGGGDALNITCFLKLVTPQAYEAAGHSVNAALFDDHVAVSDVGALRAMAAEKVAEKCVALIKSGWAWAIPRDKAPGDIHAWRKVYPDKGHGFSKKLMEQAGCTVEIDHDGRLSLNRGYVKPGAKVNLPKGATVSPAKRKEIAARAKKRAEEGAHVSNALAIRLSRQMTLAAAQVVRDKPEMALCVAIAALACATNPTNVRVDVKGGSDAWRKLDDRHDNGFGEYLALALSKSKDDRLSMLANWISQAVDVTCFTAEQLPLSCIESSEAFFLRSLPASPLIKALRDNFDSKDYFASMPADVAKNAIKECAGNIKKLTGTKAELAPQAHALAVKTGWLPPEMRVAGYDGPGVVASEVEAPKPVLKKKRKS